MIKKVITINTSFEIELTTKDCHKSTISVEGLHLLSNIELHDLIRLSIYLLKNREIQFLNSCAKEQQNSSHD